MAAEESYQDSILLKSVGGAAKLVVFVSIILESSLATVWFLFNRGWVNF